MTDLLFVFTFEATAVSTIIDLFEINVNEELHAQIHALYISQSSDVGNIAEEMLPVQIIRGHTGPGSGGTTQVFTRSLNARNHQSNSTFEACNTTIASGGTPEILWSGTFNTRLGMQQIFLPGQYPGASQSQGRFVVRLAAAPADELTMSGTVIVEEAWA